MTSTDKEVKLLPCQFFGGKPFFSALLKLGGGNWVVCSSCRAITAELSTEYDAITAWNTRAPTAREKELEAEVERLKGLVTHLDKSNDQFIGHARNLQDVIDNIIKMATGKK